jgi:hypothetical protein
MWLHCKTDILRSLVGTTNKIVHPVEWLVTEAKASEVHVAFLHSSRKSRGWAAQQLWVLQLTMQKILQACLIFKLQKPTIATCNTPKTKIFATHVAVMLCQNMKMTNFSQPKLCFVMKSLSIHLGMLTKIMLEFGGKEQSLYCDWRYKAIPKFNVFCALSNKKVFAVHTVIYVMQLDMEEFPMLILKRKVLTCHSSNKVPLDLHIMTQVECLGLKVSTEMDQQRQGH